MDVAVAVRLADLARVDVREPVVRDDLARDVEDEPAERVALVGVGVDAPVGTGEVLVHRALDLDDGALVLAQAGALLAVDDVGARRREVVGADEHLLDDVLDLLDVRRRIGEAVREHLERLLGEQVGLVAVELVGGLARALDRRADLLQLERRDLTGTRDDARWCRDALRHACPPPQGWVTDGWRGCVERSPCKPPGHPALVLMCFVHHGRSTGLRVVAAVAPSQPEPRQWHGGQRLSTYSCGDSAGVAACAHRLPS